MLGVGNKFKLFGALILCRLSQCPCSKHLISSHNEKIGSRQIIDVKQRRASSMIRRYRLVWVYGKSTIIGYLMLNPVYSYILDL